MSSACDVCESTSFQERFKKTGADGKRYSVSVCDGCGLMQTLPKPSDEELAKLYQDKYFKKRTDRGYDNYLSDSLRNELHRVWGLNLNDLGFTALEKTMLKNGQSRCLDAGCAAGYFVDYMNQRGWQAEGIEIGEEVSSFGRDKLGLKITTADFMNYKFEEPFDLVTLWASIEHFRSPKKALRSISEMLRPGGKLIISTCRTGFQSALLGPYWRYMNVPEHLFFFTLEQLTGLASRFGLIRKSYITYGSGFTGKKDADFLYNLIKTVADNAAKATDQGDMMALMLEKV